MNKVVLFMTPLLSVSLVACSGDDDNNTTSGGSDAREINLTVTGEVEGDFEGMADFHHMEMMGVQSWEISGNDTNPQTFSIQFLDVAVEGTTERPSPGAYSIGNAVNADYTVNLTHIPNGSFANSVEYSTVYDDSQNNGTLSITSSTEKMVKGNFEFTAYRVDDNMNIVGTIQATGEFSANKRNN